MKTRYLLTSILLCSTLFVCNAQTTKICIVSVADTTFLHQHVGLTIFNNFTDTIPINFSIIQQLEKKLKDYLSPAYTVSFDQLPDSVVKAKNGYFSSAKTKKIKQWITTKKDIYDLVIVIDNMELSENNRLIPKNTSGIFSRGKNIAYYTTISFFAYRTSNLKMLEFYHEGGDFIRIDKGFKLPEDRKSFTPEMINLQYEGFRNYLDSRVEHFLSKTFLVPQDRIDIIKAESRTAK